MALQPLADRIARIVAEQRIVLSEGNIARLVEVMLPTLDPIGPVMRAIEADNAAARVRFMTEVETLTSDELAALAGHAASNRSATGSRWKAAGRVFSVLFRGTERFPAFQFEDGQPRPAIAVILRALPVEMTPWQRAFWFVSSNPWLDGRVPREMIDSDAVLAAAHQEGEPVAG